MALDQIGDAARISNRLRQSASSIPQGTVGKVKKTKARFSGDNPFRADQTLRGADTALPEVIFDESQARAQQAEAITNRAAAEGRSLNPTEQAFIAKAPGGYPDMVIGERGAGGGKATMMSGEAAQAMSDSRPYGRRMLAADQPDLGLGPVAQRSLSAEMAGTVPTGSVNETLQDVYREYSRPAPGTSYDLPNEYLNLPRGELRNRLEISSGESIVDTRGIPYRAESRGGYGYEGSPYQNLDAIPLENRATQTGNPMDEYLTGFGRERSAIGADPEVIARAQDIFDRGGNPSIPFGSRVDYSKGTPFIEATRQGNELTIDTLGGSELSRRLRQSPQMQQIFNSPTERVALTRGSNAGALAFDGGQVTVVPGLERGGAFTQQPLSYSRQVEQLRNAPVANPVQQDFRAPLEQVRGRDASARLRSAELDQRIMAQNAAATGADTTNFVIKDVNPDEYYLYGSQKDTQGLLPDEVAGASRTYGYQPSESLVNVGFSSKQINPVNLGAGRVGLGVDITNKDPYSRAAVVRTQPGLDDRGMGRRQAPLGVRQVDPATMDVQSIVNEPFVTPSVPAVQRDIANVRDPRYVPVDPITPIDLELPGVRYAEKSGLQADITPELAIGQDQRAGARLRAIANLEQGAVDKYMAAPREAISPDIQRRADNAYNAILQGDAYDSSAANMQNAMRIANEQTVPQSDVILTQISNQGPGQTLPIRGQRMDFESALAVMKPYERGGAAEQVLRLPVVPTQAPEQAQLSKRLRLAQQVGTPESASVMSDEAMGLYKQVAATDPGVVPNEIRRGVQYTMVPEGETGQGYKIRLDNPGQPVLDPATGQRMRWQGQPIETYNPVEAGGADVEFATRARATKPQMRNEEYEQLGQAIKEGYVPTVAKDPMSQVVLTGDDLADIRGGLSQVEARQAQQHNLVRQMTGLPPAYPDSLAMEQIISGVPTAQRSTELIRNPPAQGGIFMMGPDEYGYGARMAAQMPSSGPPIQIQSGGMLNAFMTEPLPARTMRPSVRQIPATEPMFYQPPAQVPSQIQPARYSDRPDLDWQRSPSFRFPKNVWQGRGSV